MKRATSSEHPPFFWQGFLVLIPLLILSVAGFVGLHRDKAQVHHEAVRQAQALVDEFADRLEQSLQTTNAGDDPASIVIQTDLSGDLTDPPPYSFTPHPFPLFEEMLDESQRAAWADVNRAEPNSTTLVERLRHFLSLQPSEHFEGVARYRLALAWHGQGDIERARQTLVEFVAGNPRVLGETGVPLAPLAHAKLWQWRTANDTEATNHLIAAATTALEQPSPLTPYLLRQLAQSANDPAGNRELELAREILNRQWVAWEEDELARRIHDEAKRALQIGVLYSNSMGFHVADSAPAQSLPFCLWIDVIEPSDVFQESSASSQDSSVAKAKPGTSFKPSATYPPEARMTILSNEFAQASVPGLLSVAGPPGRVTVTMDPRVLSWFLVRDAVNTNAVTFRCYPSLESSPDEMAWDARPWMVQPVEDVLRDLQERLPDYLGFSLELAGRGVISSNRLMTSAWVGGGKGGGARYRESVPSRPPEALARARKFADDTEYLHAAVHLISSDKLYAGQRGRAVWAGLLIAGASLAALLGVAAARRAFHQQHRLARLQANFLSSVSHELRAPIASVRLMAEGLEQNRITDTERRREYFHFIVQECRRLSGLIENVLNISRIEQGRQEYTFEPTDITRLAEDTVQLLEPAARERGVRLRLHLPPGVLEPSELDGPSIQQALINLIDNAIKHSPDGESVDVSVTVSRGSNEVPRDSSERSGKDDGKDLRIIVADRGAGIPAQDRERIFERFYRRGTELRRQTQGVGIGLHIVKKIAEAHHGRVWVEGEEGSGSRFILDLPWVQAGFPNAKNVNG